MFTLNVKSLQYISLAELELIVSLIRMWMKDSYISLL